MPFMEATTAPDNPHSMHDSMIAQMEMNSSAGHGHDGDFHGSHWVDMNSYNPSQHQSPAHEYNGFSFITSPQSLSVDSSFTRMSPPASTSHPPLQPLIMPQWPSMLTSPSTSSSTFSSPPILPTAPASAPMSVSTSSRSTHSLSNPNPRKTLTDADRRKMCQYHEDNPTVKQTEIGAMFGVERSTVSKVLRQKEKYLFPDDGSKSPIKRSKGKFPDIERALSNWARNSQKQGVAVTDAMIREKARFFATTVGNSESFIKVNSTSWLEKFKQKNSIAGAKAKKNSSKRAKESAERSANASPALLPAGVSPASPASPQANSQNNTKASSPESYMAFQNGFRTPAPQSSTSLSQTYTETANAPGSFSAGPASPTSPYFTDSNGNPTPFVPIQSARLPPPSTFSRPRSQTFPLVNMEPGYISPPPSSEPMTPKYMAPTTLQSPMEDGNNMLPPLPQAHSQQQQQQQQQQQGVNMDRYSPSDHHNNHHHHLSSPAMAPPPPTLNMNMNVTNTHHPRLSPASTPLSSVPGSPTQDEARQALEVVLQFFQKQPRGAVDQSEYVVMGKLMERLGIRRPSLSVVHEDAGAAAQYLPMGGLQGQHVI